MSRNAIGQLTPPLSSQSCSVVLPFGPGSAASKTRTRLLGERCSTSRSLTIFGWSPNEAQTSTSWDSDSIVRSSTETEPSCDLPTHLQTTKYGREEFGVHCLSMQ